MDNEKDKQTLDKQENNGASNDDSSEYQPHSGQFVGLVNQAMTCYLNSVIQMLFMTPEFRNALYRWKFDGLEEQGKRNIPYQLQRLFLQLQTSQSACATTDLTRSFGWDSSEAWQQHDVQELCRVMFDALEAALKNTDQADLVSRLYEAKMKDYVKCLACGGENAREDTFMDVPLVVRPFGSTVAYKSLEEALEAFVTPETLDGSNQYHCERCKKKCDAQKGLQFLSFPYILTFQLKRFDFDPLTMHRIKLNDEVTFPDVLDVNRFVVQKTGPPGPYIYDLFAVMVHSGSANGGHYYAYVKSLWEGKWYCFNDVQVTSASNDEIKRTYGGASTTYSRVPALSSNHISPFTSSTNAYMLIYRRQSGEPDSNRIPMKIEDCPPHIHELIELIHKDEQELQTKKQQEKSTCKVKLFCQHPSKMRWIERQLALNKDVTLEEATQTAHTILGLEDVVPLQQCRLVLYDDCHEALERSLEEFAGKTVETILGGVQPFYRVDFLLETKEKAEDLFQVYAPGGHTLNVRAVHLEREEVKKPKRVYVHPTENLSVITDRVCKLFEIEDPTTVRYCLEKTSSLEPLTIDPKQKIESLQLGKAATLYVEFEDEKDRQRQFTKSHFYHVLECLTNTICVHIALPEDAPATPRFETKKIGENGDASPEISEEEVDPEGEEYTRRKRFFRAWPYKDYETDHQMIRVYLDKRMSLDEFKDRLRPYVGGEGGFTLHPISSTSLQSPPIQQPTELLEDAKLEVRRSDAPDDCKFSVALHRLNIDEDQCIQLIGDVYPTAADCSHIETLKKKVIIPKIKDNLNQDVALNRCRLRRCNADTKCPGRVLKGDERLNDRDVFVEILPQDKEADNDKSDVYPVYLQRAPVGDHYEKAVEIRLKPSENLEKQLLSEIDRCSGIAKDDLEICLETGAKHLEWTQEFPSVHNPEITVIYFRNKNDTLIPDDKTVSDRKSIRLGSHRAGRYAALRKEKALKIYSPSSPPPVKT